MGNFYIVTLKCSTNFANCDFTLMFYPIRIFFAANTTDPALSNLKPLMMNFNCQSSLQFFLTNFRVPKPVRM